MSAFDQLKKKVNQGLKASNKLVDINNDGNTGKLDLGLSYSKDLGAHAFLDYNHRLTKKFGTISAFSNVKVSRKDYSALAGLRVRW